MAPSMNQTPHQISHYMNQAPGPLSHQKPSGSSLEVTLYYSTFDTSRAWASYLLDHASYGPSGLEYGCANSDPQLIMIPTVDNDPQCLCQVLVFD